MKSIRRFNPRIMSVIHNEPSTEYKVAQHKEDYYIVAGTTAMCYMRFRNEDDAIREMQRLNKRSK